MDGFLCLCSKNGPSGRQEDACVRWGCFPGEKNGELLMAVSKKSFSLVSVEYPSSG